MTRTRLRKGRFLGAIALLLIAAVLGVFLFIHARNQNYKLPYKDEIAKYAKEYKLDAYLVASIIHVESGNRESAVSSAGAIGLMQLMPDTGDWIAEKLDIDKETLELTDAETNIRFGCWYLNFLGERFAERATILAAYNAGHNVVSRWLSDPDYSTNGSTLHTIPYKETEQYVKKVNNAYEKYKQLYPDAF